MIDQERFSRIAHQGIQFSAPISNAKVTEIEALLPLGPNTMVLDLGCGRAEWLIQMAERHGVRGVWVDRSADAIAEARSAAARRVASSTIELVEQDATGFDVPEASVDVGLCVGSTHVLGGERATLRAFRRWLRPGGHVVIGAGYWQQEPSQEYLDGFGGSKDELVSHADNVTVALEEGFVPLYAAVSSPDDWDRYEGLYARNVEVWAMDNPNDSERDAMLDRIRRWRDGYLRWGRSTMGFCLYLHAIPPDPGGLVP